MSFSEHSKSPDGTRSPSPSKFGYSANNPSSPASSGFSSRQSSQDYINLEELTPVQQQLSEINHRYNMLGVRIIDRKEEIECVLDELKRHMDTYKTLSSFIIEKERQIPKYAIPATKEHTDQLLSIIKVDSVITVGGISWLNFSMDLTLVF